VGVPVATLLFLYLLWRLDSDQSCERGSDGAALTTPLADLKANKVYKDFRRCIFLLFLSPETLFHSPRFSERFSLLKNVSRQNMFPAQNKLQGPKTYSRETLFHRLFLPFFSSNIVSPRFFLRRFAS